MLIATAPFTLTYMIFLLFLHHHTLLQQILGLFTHAFSVINNMIPIVTVPVPKFNFGEIDGRETPLLYLFEIVLAIFVYKDLIKNTITLGRIIAPRYDWHCNH